MNLELSGTKRGTCLILRLGNMQCTICLVSRHHSIKSARLDGYPVFQLRQAYNSMHTIPQPRRDPWGGGSNNNFITAMSVQETSTYLSISSMMASLLCSYIFIDKKSYPINHEAFRQATALWEVIISSQRASLYYI